MKEDKTVPQLRFPEFTDAWKQRELGEIAERVTRRNSSLESQTPLTISAEYGLIDQNKFFGKRIAAKDLSNYYLIQKGEFAYNKSTSNDAPWGAIKRLDCYNNGALSTLYIVFKIKDNKSCYSDFLVTYYGTSLWHKGVKEIATEGARNHGLLNVSPSDFFRTKLVIPQDFEEQRKIGAFFTQLDNTITLQQRKLNSLQKLKKGLLQKMFPKKGENIPEIRFPEFSDAWKQRKLEQIIDVGSGRDYKHLSEGGIPVYGTGGYMLSVNEALSWEEDAIGIGRKGTIDKPYILQAPFWTVDTLFYAIPKKEQDLDFLYCIFQNIDWKKKDESTGVPSLSKTIINKTYCMTPNYDEQKKIGCFFSKIDNLITLQQRKLESLQKLKKGLLQQMFI